MSKEVIRKRDSFFNKNAPTTAAIDLPGGTITAGAQLQIYNNASAKYWKLLQQYRISNNTASAKNADGTYNIGLTPESNGDIICYYLPGETGHAYTDKTESCIRCLPDVTFGIRTASNCPQ